MASPIRPRSGGCPGREFLQAILDGRLPAPPIARTLSFWLTEIGDGLAVFEGDAGPHLLNPLGDRAWRLGADPDRQRGRLRRPDAAARRRQLCDDRDQGQFLPADHQGHGPRPRRRARVGRGRRIISCEARVVDAKGRLLGARDLDAHGARERRRASKPAPEAA